MNAESPHGQRASLRAPQAPPRFDAPPGGLRAEELEQLIVIPLRGVVLFPGPVQPVVVSDAAALLGLDAAVRGERPIGLIAQRRDAERPGLDDLYGVGTLGSVLRMSARGDGQRQVLVHGRERFRVLAPAPPAAYLQARVQLLPTATPDTIEVAARTRHLRQQALEALALLPQPVPGLDGLISEIDDPQLLTDLIASGLDVPLADKQLLLEQTDLALRMKRVSELLARQIEILGMTQRLRDEAKGSMDRAQREYFLREQLRTIRRELGEDQAEHGVEELRVRVRAVKMPEKVEQAALREVEHLAHVPEGAAEHAMLRSYLDWLVDLPWSTLESAPIDLRQARAILDEDHFDLEKVKRRIIEFLAIRKLNPGGRSPILCFVGPPGVGKTSLGQSIARAMGRRFVRQSLGGVHDEAEIRGHRRTYVGALPGRIIQGIRRAGTRDPVFMLDEIDKLGQSFHGDPAAALLEVLDPAQNQTFEDHYLGVPFDLSQVLFIGTANVLTAIPGPLRDRMEVIDLPGYTEEDKLAIARRYLLPRQEGESGLAPETVRLEDAALQAIIRGYTREAGLRQLERELGAVCRAVAMRVAGGEAAGAVTIAAADLRGILGPERQRNEVALRTAQPGVATGLAWTPAGGDILFVEATRTPGEGRLILTGQLGDVMKESAQAAQTLSKARAPGLGVPAEELRGHDIHLHVPAGAIPKDGPSAGVTMFVALVSLLLGRRVRADTAMTGEISLRGLVLPVGGIKEKVLAARRAGLRRVLLPALNQPDYEEDVPEALRRELEVQFLQSVDEALALALE